MIECYPDVFAFIDGQKYLVGHPCDWSVSIGKPDANGNLEPVPLDGELMDEVRGFNCVISYGTLLTKQGQSGVTPKK